jgi:hypothetical protein
MFHKLQNHDWRVKPQNHNNKTMIRALSHKTIIINHDLRVKLLTN